MHSAEPNLAYALGLLRRRAGVVALCFVVAVGLAAAYSLHQPKRYTATTSLLFNNQPIGQQVAGLQAVVNTDQQAQQDTNVQVLQLGDVAQKTAVAVGHGLTADGVKGNISVSPQSDTTVVNLSVTSASPELAANIANTYSTIFVNEQENANHQYYDEALATVTQQLAKLPQDQRSGPQGLALQTRAQSLSTLAQLQSGTVQIAQYATVPTAASSPRVARNIAVAAFLGLLLGLAAALAIERLDQRIREPEDLEAIYQLPLLGVVPDTPTLSRGRKAGLATSETDAFQLIHAHLRYFNVDRALNTMMIVSAAPGDGKTTIACQLAAAAARMGSRVLLIEADLRRPTMAQQFDVEQHAGLADVLIGASSLTDAAQPVNVMPLTQRSGFHDRAVDLLVAGAVLPPNPAELIESHAMEALVQRAKTEYDLVVIDTPPLNVVSDAFPLLRKVDGVVIVGRVGRNRRDVAQRLHATLATVGAPLLGVIANGFRARAGGRYSYDYSYESFGAGTAPAGTADGATANGSAGDEPKIPSATSG